MPKKPMSPRSTAASKRAGGQSPKHRGWKPDAEAAPKKARWNADERAARGRSTQRPRGAADGERRERFAADGRPNWEPPVKRDRPERPARGRGDERVSRWDRDERPARSDRPARPARDERAPRGERTERAERWNRDERSGRDDRSGAPRGDQRGFGDRADRPARGRGDDRGTARGARWERDERPARDDRAPRADRTERWSRDERPQRFDRDTRGERPQRGWNDARPARDDRAPRADRGDRTHRFERADRFDRFDRAARPERAGRDSYPPRALRPVRSGNAERSGFPERSGERREREVAPIQHEDVVFERLEAEATSAEEVAGIGFAELGLGQNIVRELAELGATAPFPIQVATIPDVLAGRDVLGRGRTGSGKTIAFAAPLAESLLKARADWEPGRRREMGRAPSALILAPTRELALQIDRTVQPIARSVGLFTTQIYGGVPYQRQVGALQRGVDIVIGTPGRIEDLTEQGHLDLSKVRIAVLDEADHMCDLGFLEPVQRLLRRTAPGSQKLLFSATLDAGVQSLVAEFLPDPAVHEVAGEDQASGTISHHVFLMKQFDKQPVLAELAAAADSALVFVRTRAFAEDVTDLLEDHGIRAVPLHGDLNQARRTRNLERFTSGKAQVLVATDVAARGIHVDDVELVIQADAPDEFKTYLHRSGRTGRAGKPGTVVTLVPFNRRRRTEELLARAEIEATWTEVTPGHPAVMALFDR